MSVPSYPFHSLLPIPFPPLKLYLIIHREMEWNDHKRMERNGMYLNKGKEWKRME